MVNKLSTLNNLLHTDLEGIKEIDYHVVILESQFSSLVAMTTTVEESMKIATIVTSLSNFTNIAPIVTSVSTIQESMITWDYVTMLFIKNSSRLSHLHTVGRDTAFQESTGTPFASVSRGTGRKLQKSSIGPQ